MKLTTLFLLLLFVMVGCNDKQQTTNDQPTLAEYFNYSETGVKTAGVQMIPIETPKGTFKVWTKRIGNNPRIKILILHGGPALTHEYMECFQSFFSERRI